MKGGTGQRRAAYEAKRDRLVRRLAAIRKSGAPVRLAKRTSNLFRVRDKPQGPVLDVRDLNVVIAVDAERNLAEVEGMATYESIVDATLIYGRIPAVVPQLKTITAGGAVTGGGIESSSFRHGFVHESIAAMEILCGCGELIYCTPDNEHSDLFFGFANSYGTFGYALRLWIRLERAAPYVRLVHRRWEEAPRYFADMEAFCIGERGPDSGTDFVDGTVFGRDALYRTEGSFRAAVSATSNYRFMRIYYRSIRTRTEDFLATRDYIWRWDTDWFWCSRAFGAEIPPLRFLVGVFGLLRSTTYWRIRDWNERLGLLRRAGLMRNVEWVIQDVEIPVDRAAAFLEFLLQEIGIRPIWICPVMAPVSAGVFPLYRTDPQVLYINFGFWGGVQSAWEPGYFNRRVEERVVALGGKKSLYSDAYFSLESFWQQYDQKAYDRLKRRYDPDGVFPDLYSKCVKGSRASDRPGPRPERK